MAAFKRRGQFFQRFRSRIVVARIAVSFFFVPEDAVERGGVLVEIGGSQMDRSGGRNHSAVTFPVAGVNYKRIEFHFFFQRTPSRVSSITMPLSKSQVRISSAFLNSLAFLAALRSAIFCSISASVRESFASVGFRTSKMLSNAPRNARQSSRFPARKRFSSIAVF